MQSAINVIYAVLGQQEREAASKRIIEKRLGNGGVEKRCRGSQLDEAGHVVYTRCRLLARALHELLRKDSWRHISDEVQQRGRLTIDCRKRHRPVWRELDVSTRKRARRPASRGLGQLEGKINHASISIRVVVEN